MYHKPVSADDRLACHCLVVTATALATSWQRNRGTTQNNVSSVTIVKSIQPTTGRGTLQRKPMDLQRLVVDSHDQLRFDKVRIGRARKES